DEVPYTFSADNAAVLFGGVRQDLASHRQYPTSYLPELYHVPATGGRVDMVLTVPAEYVQLSKDGNKLVYHDKKGGENEWRKHHTSSVARDLWLYDVAKGSHQKLTSFYGENRNPGFANNDQDLIYLSEASGSFNVHKLSLDKPDQSQQLTKFDKHPVRFLSASEAGSLAFSYDGELYTLREGEAPQKLDITLRTQNIKNKDQYISINGGVREMSISHDGKEVAFISRGDVFVSSVDGSTTKRITTSPEQEQFLSFAPDG